MTFLRNLSLAGILFMGYSFSGCTLQDHLQPSTIEIAGLSSLTGNWSSLGNTTAAAMEIAEEDINAYFEKKGSPYRLSMTTYDTKLDATLATGFFTTAADAGHRFFIGPQSSAELAAILPLTKSRNALVISQGSTAGSLAIADDPVFRFCPADKIEGAAIAKTIFAQGIRGLITIARDDAGNKGLQTATGASFTTAGGEVQALTPYGTAVTDFSSQIAAIKTQITALTTTYGAAKVAVYLASFDECVNLFKQAAVDPVLSSVRWYGADGVALSAALIADPAAADFAIATQFFTPTFGLSDAYKSAWEPLITRIKTKTGIDPDAFGIAVYDAMWVIAKTVEAGNGVPASLDNLESLFTTQANAYTGATGPTTLDTFGDRATGSFDYFGIEKIGGIYQWKLVGKSN
ncbi:ABC transporter substrate-binding protein [Larkinella terrae]|uniref:ABC transporter substrate-binding protein n=1 Tax=Larkinella terrae TaxID=2025311 RepID=A0A7K0EQ86_9BACT|nr:ABC transporter substrate-binding protein [Larkinella terrae]MRS63974.1 ABC transporter substrate-binding protein [Larkinella terrae]